MLLDVTEDQIVATGFNRNHRLNGEGGRIVEEWFVETVIDRVETTGMTWLALTMTCALATSQVRSDFPEGIFRVLRLFQFQRRAGVGGQWKERFQHDAVHQVAS